VLQSVLAGLLRLQSRGIKLDVGLYTSAVTLLTDDNEDVRLEALRLVWYDRYLAYSTRLKFAEICILGHWVSSIRTAQSRQTPPNEH